MSLARLFFLLILMAIPAAATAQAFPGAVGWGAQSRGGRGGAIIRVTNLNAAGPGSLRAAIEARGPRIIVFEVGGVIDLGLTTLDINEPFLTIAGQTAPSPGITIIRGGIDVHGHDVIIRHIRIRTGVSGQARRSGWEADAVSTVGAYNVVVDHCTMTWALDENLSASGPRFQGQSVADWRRATSHDITFSNNLLAEGIAEGSHPKGEHSKGSLIHDNVTNILIYRNIYAHNMERSPLLKGGVHAAVINNLIFDPGAQAMHYNLMDLEWADHPHQDGQLSAVGNVLRGGFSTRSDIAFLTIGGVGDLRYFGRDNVAVDRQGRPLPMFGRYTTSAARIVPVARPDIWPAGIAVLPSNQVETELLRHSGARPWDRDAQDLRIIFDVVEGRGHIIDNEDEVGGYPHPQPTRAAFVEAEWNLETMEPLSGHYPGEQAGRIQQPTSVRDADMRRDRR